MNVKPILSISSNITGIISVLCAKVNTELANKKIEDDIYFVKSENEIIVVNNSNKGIQISFPARKYQNGKCYMILSKKNQIITEDVVRQTLLYSNQFEIMIENELANKCTEESNDITLTASGYINRRLMGKTILSDQIMAEIIDNNLYISTQPSYKIHFLSLLIISGEGNEPQRKYQNITPLYDKGNMICIMNVIGAYKYTDNISVEVVLYCCCQ